MRSRDLSGQCGRWKAQDVCAAEATALTSAAPGYEVACHFPEGP
ncbi:hypothetical protein [Spongiactinospora rosea]|nr:hypothetical protein [Spongiactinospora rosea]